MVSNQKTNCSAVKIERSGRYVSIHGDGIIVTHPADLQREEITHEEFNHYLSDAIEPPDNLDAEEFASLHEEAIGLLKKGLVDRKQMEGYFCWVLTEEGFLLVKTKILEKLNEITRSDGTIAENIFDYSKQEDNVKEVN